MPEAYIVSALRTAGGRRGGRLRDWHPADLGGAAIDAIIDRTGIDPTSVDDVIFGCVTQVGEQSMNVARNVALSSKLPESVPATTIDRQCGSSQQAIHFAAQSVLSGAMDVVIAGGVESMSRVPMGTAATLPQQHGMGRCEGERMLHRYRDIVFSQFAGAEQVAVKYGLTKDQLDHFALGSHQKAAAAARSGAFDEEIVPLPVVTNEGQNGFHSADEGIRFDASLEAIQGVKLIQEGGRLSAASASQICDGSSAMLIVNEAGLKRVGLEPLARIHHMTMAGGDPVIMLEAPLQATEKALRKAGMKISEIDLYEVNEAFASIPVAWQIYNKADPGKLNVNGGAIALGHPLGASGAKLMATLVHALRLRNKRYGLQTMCEGGGMANVTIVERL